MVEQLGDLGHHLVVGLVFRRHPDLGGLFDDLLADEVNAGVELANSAGTVWALERFGAQLGEQLIESLHVKSLGDVGVLECPLAQQLNLSARVVGAEHARPGDEGVGTRSGGHLDGLLVDAAVDLQPHVESAA